MASESSFDIVSKVDMQEAKNAVDQALKELGTRFDLKDSGSKIEWDKEELVVSARKNRGRMMKFIRTMNPWLDVIRTPNRIPTEVWVNPIMTMTKNATIVREREGCR